MTMINNYTDRTLDVVFSRFKGFSVTINLRQKPKEFRGSVEFQDRELEHARNSFGPLPQGYCARKNPKS